MKRLTWLETLLWRVIDSALRKLEEISGPQVRAVGSFGSPRLKTIQPPKPMITTDPITNEQEIDANFRPLTAGGNPAPVDGDVQWEKLDGDATLGATTQGGQVQTFRSQDSGEGTSHFRATADADLGSGVVPISLDYELVVVLPSADHAGGSFGTPRIKTPNP